MGEEMVEEKGTKQEVSLSVLIYGKGWMVEKTVEELVEELKEWEKGDATDEEDGKGE
jgi:hypothetical protein